MTTMTVEEFRRYVQGRRGGRRRGAPRYPDERVTFAVEHARRARAAGRSLNAAAAELGLSGMTLAAWISRGVATPGPRLREVVVQAGAVGAPATARTVEVQTASGHVVRGLSVSDAASLLRALS